jgi:hypothetical protein
VRIVCHQDGWRMTTAVTSPEGEARSLCVTCTAHGPLLYVSVCEDSTPMCCVHNLCPFPLQFGQAMQGKATSGKCYLAFSL